MTAVATARATPMRSRRRWRRRRLGDGRLSCRDGSEVLMGVQPNACWGVVVSAHGAEEVQRGPRQGAGGDTAAETIACSGGPWHARGGGGVCDRARPVAGAATGTAGGGDAYHR